MHPTPESFDHLYLAAAAAAAAARIEDCDLDKNDCLNKIAVIHEPPPEGM